LFFERLFFAPTNSTVQITRPPDDSEETTAQKNEKNNLGNNIGNRGSDAKQPPARSYRCTGVCTHEACRAHGWTDTWDTVLLLVDERERERESSVT